MRQADAQDRRRRMTQRRGELTSRIRKQKKSQYLAQKRNWVSTASTAATETATATATATTTPTDQIRPLVKEFCSIPTLDRLQSLHQALKSTELKATEDNWLVILDAEDQMTCASLLGHLRGLASMPDTLPMVLDVLVKLTAISYVPPGSEPLNYYGTPPLSWCASISYNGAWLSHLVHLAPTNEAACVVLGNLVGEANSQSFVNLRKAGMIPALLSAVHKPAAAWALTNAIRHDKAELGRTYCCDAALSASLLEQLLKESAVATQAAWMVASLTSREDEVVQYLMNHPTFSKTLAECLQNPTSPGQSVPLLQSLGNIASATSEQNIPYVGLILSRLPGVTNLIAQILQTSSQRDLLQQAAWVAGIFLYDAGTPDHPSTTIGAPALVPVLFGELGANTRHAVDIQRELTQALWNALMKPSLEQSQTGPVSLPLPSWETVRSSLTTFVKLVDSMDSDAVLAALCVIDLLIQLNDGNDILLEALEEENFTNVLEKVCDSPNEEAGEIAANLLDDYIYKDQDVLLEETNGHGDDLKGNFAFGDPSMMGGMGHGMGRGRAATIPAWMAGS